MITRDRTGHYEWALILIGLVIVLYCLSSRVEAHDSWLNGEHVDPITKQKCCGENDCKMVPERLVHIFMGGWYKIDDTGEQIPPQRVQVSPDGAIWRCRMGGETRCFFAPKLGS